MNTLTANLFCRIRSPRLQAASTVLLLLLQRTPVLKFLVEAETGAALGVPQILRSAVVVAATLGAVDTVSGATTFVSNPKSPVSATVNSPFGLVFSITGSASSGGGAHSWTIYGPLPPGLSIPGAVAGSGNTLLLNTGTGSITGTPTQAGTWDVTFKAWEKANQSGEAWNTQKLGPLPVVRITVTGSGGSPLAFTTQPMSTSVAVGGTFNVGVTTSGTPAPTLQWRKNGTPIQGATSEIYSIGSVSLSDAGSYTVVATNTGGSITSDAAVLTVTAPAAITSQPSSQQVAVGGAASFSVTVTGTPAPTYQWRKNGVSISGKTQSTLTIDPVTAGDVGTYTVRVQNSTATVTSSAAELTLMVISTAPAITTQPAAQQVAAGGSASFSVVATGDPAPTYQWKKNGQTISGATNSSYSIAQVAAGDAGSYTVVVTNSAGSVTSGAAELTLLVTGTAPAITTHPAAQQVAEGGLATFTVVATGDPAPTFQWRKDGQAISGATGSSFVISPVTAGDVGSYTVRVQNATGTVTSNAAALTLQPTTGPEIIHQPVAQSVVPGGGATFQVDSGSVAGLTYQWQKDGVDLPGATGPILNLSQVQESDAGTYTVVVSNGAASTVSAAAVLTVGTTGSNRMSNISTRAFVGTGSNKLTPGFVVEGDMAKTVLIRAVGPTLGTFGVQGVLEDPMIRLFSSGQELVVNDDWGSGDQSDAIAAAAQMVGAFAIDPTSKDAALLITLNPGVYTVQVAGVGGLTGVCLVEVYDASPR